MAKEPELGLPVATGNESSIFQQTISPKSRLIFSQEISGLSDLNSGRHQDVAASSCLSEMNFLLAVRAGGLADSNFTGTARLENINTVRNEGQSGAETHE